MPAMRPSTPLTKRGESSVDSILGQLDGLVDDDRVGHVVAPQQLVDAHAQHGAVDGGHPLQRPALGVFGEQLVDPRAVAGDALDQRRPCSR